MCGARRLDRRSAGCTRRSSCASANRTSKPSRMIWNILEQHPGAAMLAAARQHAPHCAFTVRVTHASGMLEGKYTADTVFPPNDHRRHRPRSWLTNGVQKIRTLDFLTTRMTLGQAALKWLLAEPLVITTLPNIYDTDQLREFALASDQPDLTSAEMDRIAELAEQNFGVDEEPMAYKGTMARTESEEHHTRA